MFSDGIHKKLELYSNSKNYYIRLHKKNTNGAPI